MSDLRRTGALVTIISSALACLVLTPSSSMASDRDPRIVHGHPTNTVSFPWQAQLTIKNKFLCGGELISPTVVLTAAHCLAIASSPDQVQVTLGRDRTFEGGVTQVAAAIYVNPGFQASRLDFDWAFAVLSSPAPSQFTPIKIAGPNETALWNPGSAATVTGYGTTSENGDLSKTLREVTIPILGDDVCGSSSSYGRKFDPSAMLCAGDPQAGKDSCQGDSGGPLVVKADDGSFRLAGIVSFGRGCAEQRFPGIYTRIADPALSAQLVQQLNQQPTTAGYPYLGSGGACVTATTSARQATSQARRADRAETRAQRGLTRAQAQTSRARKHFRTHPSPATRHQLAAAEVAQRNAAAALHTDQRLAKQAQKSATRATAQAATACA
jgi:trypsin